MNTLRAILGLALLAGAAFLFRALIVGGGAATAEARTFSSSADCASCHALEYDEWSAGQHATSWTGEAVRELSNDFANQDCIDCHAPRPVFETGIGERVLPRTLRRVEGVDCISCHALPGGGVAGGFTDPNAACRPVERIELVRPELCAGCHNQHLTVDQWRSSDWAKQGVTCIDCHMPYRDGDPSKGRMHGMHGGSSLENLKNAVELTGRFDEASGGWVVEVANVGAGHSFPTDERSRAADVFWRPLGDDEGPWRHLHRFRSPYRSEVDIPETLLLVHERRQIPVLDRGEAALTELLSNDAPGEPVSGPIEVALFYKRSPYYYGGLSRPQEDPDAVLVHDLRLER